MIVDQPPITRHVDTISLEDLSHAYLGYIASMREDSAALLTQFLISSTSCCGSVDLEALDSTQFTHYSELCGTLLARAHSQSPLAHAVTGYVGSTGKFAKAIASWAKKYADQCERDFEALQKAAKKGVIPVETGV